MGSKIDLHGQKFNRLTVLSETPYDKRPSKRYVYWDCICDCGNAISVESYHLRKGQIKSCGCYATEQLIARNQTEIHKQQVSQSRTKNLTGQKFGMLTVIERVENRRYGSAAWLCKCDCGGEKIVSSGELTKGDTQSCGCIKSRGETKIANILKEANISFLREKTFNDCRFPDSNYLAYFDFYVNNQYLIEYDGEQHFKVSEWNPIENGLLKSQIRDKIKNTYCFNYNIPLIRIPYWHYDDLCLDDLLLETSNFIVKEVR